MCRSHGPPATSAVNVRGSSVRSEPTADAVGGGLRCYTSQAKCSRADAVLGWLTRVSRAACSFVTCDSHRESGRGSGAARTPVSPFPTSPAACISERMSALRRWRNRLKRLRAGGAEHFLASSMNCVDWFDSSHAAFRDPAYIHHERLPKFRDVLPSCLHPNVLAAALANKIQMRNQLSKSSLSACNARAGDIGSRLFPPATGR